MSAAEKFSDEVYPSSPISPSEEELHLTVVPDPVVLYGPELPSFAYVKGHNTVGGREIAVYEQMSPEDALLVSRIRYEYPIALHVFPGQLLKILRGEASVQMRNRDAAGVHLLGACITLRQTTFFPNLLQ